jgi:7-carboxy-7-deazaguanine synthase
MMSYPIMEHFYTVQGEGVHSGTAAYFVRLGGCDIGCIWCDVKDSWDASKHPHMLVSEIVENIAKTSATNVVITGGEPAMYDLNPLCDELHKAGYIVHIETSGAYPINGQIDWVCVSPKKFKAALPSEIAKAHELKVVVYNKHDIEWAQTFESQISEDCIKLLQPEWDVRKKSETLIIDFIKNNPEWAISIQTHKYLDIP